MELLFSFLTLLASAAIAQILIDKNEINRLRKDAYGEIPGTKTAETRAAKQVPFRKAPQGVQRPGRIVPYPRPPHVPPTFPRFGKEAPLQDLPPILLRRV